MSDNILNDKAETAIAALVTVLVAALDPVPVVVTGRDTTDAGPDDLKNGLIQCSAEGQGDEEIIGTGNFWLEGLVEMMHSGIPDPDGTDPTSDPTAAAQAMITAVTNGIIIDTLAADLSAASTELTVYPKSVLFEAPTRDFDPKGFWVDRIKWKMLCCASDL